MKKYSVLGKWRGLLCNPEIVQIKDEHTKDKETLESSLKLEAGVDTLISYEEISEGDEC